MAKAAKTVSGIAARKWGQLKRYSQEVDLKGCVCVWLEKNEDDELVIRIIAVEEDGETIRAVNLEDESEVQIADKASCSLLVVEHVRFYQMDAQVYTAFELLLYHNEEYETVNDLKKLGLFFLEDQRDSRQVLIHLFTTQFFTL